MDTAGRWWVGHDHFMYLWREIWMMEGEERELWSLPPAEQI